MSLSWDEVEGVPLLRWSAVPGVTAVFSGRRGGVSEGAYESLNLGLRSGDELGRVVENRRRLCAAAAVAPERTSSCHQIHSAVVQDAAADPAQPFDDPAVSSPDGDGLVTRVPGRGVVAFGSDCIPIVVARADGTGVGVCHAGWRGLLGGVVEQTVERLGEGELVAAVGPCAGRDRYEVGPDVAAPLAGRFGPAALNGRNADLAACAAIALERSGVGAVDVAGLCTIAEEERFLYVTRDDLAALAEAGVTRVGENRSDALLEKREGYEDAFRWDFIGHLQSRKARDVVGRVELIHALSSESTARQIDSRSERPQGVLVEVNTAADPAKEGVAPDDLDAFLELLAGLPNIRVQGLMTMPAFAEEPAASRPAFAALRELAARCAERYAGTHAFDVLSMGTSQDYAVAAAEGATIVRLGSVLYGGRPTA